MIAKSNQEQVVSARRHWSNITWCWQWQTDEQDVVLNKKRKYTSFWHSWLNFTSTLWTCLLSFFTGVVRISAFTRTCFASFSDCTCSDFVWNSTTTIMQTDLNCSLNHQKLYTRYYITGRASGSETSRKTTPLSDIQCGYDLIALLNVSHLHGLEKNKISWNEKQATQTPQNPAGPADYKNLSRKQKHSLYNLDVTDDGNRKKAVTK